MLNGEQKTERHKIEKKNNNALANYLKICSQTVKSRVTLLNNVDVACVLLQIPLNNKCERVFNVNGLAYSNTLCWNQKRAICKHIIGMAGGKGCEKYNKKWERERDRERERVTNKPIVVAFEASPQTRGTEYRTNINCIDRKSAACARFADSLN